jgi:hypothetical protein
MMTSHIEEGNASLKCCNIYIHGIYTSMLKNKNAITSVETIENVLYLTPFCSRVESDTHE